jgi:hypothetical protein
MVFYSLSMPVSSCKSNRIWKTSRRIAHGRNRRHSNTFKHQMLGLTDNKRDLIGNLLLLSLKRMVRSGGHNPVLGRRIVCLQPLISVTIQRSFKPLTITCRHSRRIMEVTIYNVISMDLKETRK